MRRPCLASDGPPLHLELYLDRCHDANDSSVHVQGILRLSPSADLFITFIRIEFVGASYLLAVLPPTRIATGDGVAKATHRFLTLDHPDRYEYLPRDRQILSGRTYDLPISFEVPVRLLSSACRHDVSNLRVRHAHCQLPPSLGEDKMPSSTSWTVEASSFASIRYGMVTEIGARPTGDSHVKTASSVFRLQFISGGHSSTPPYTSIGHTGATQDTVISRRRIGKGLFRSHLGDLTMELDQPQRIHLPAFTYGELQNYLHKFIVRLRFTACQSTTQPPPDIGEMGITIKASTFYDIKGQSDLPHDSASNSNVRKHVSVRTLQIASRTLGNIAWTAASESGPQTLGMGLVHKTAEVVVPVEIPKELADIPSFHSCLVSRVYSMSISLSTRNARLRKPMTLCTPLEVSAQPAVRTTSQDCIDIGSSRFYGIRPCALGEL